MKNSIIKKALVIVISLLIIQGIMFLTIFYLELNNVSTSISKCSKESIKQHKLSSLKKFGRRGLFSD